MKRRIRLSESDLHRIVKESVRRILKEDNGTLGRYYSGGYQVCVFPTSNGGAKAYVIEIGSPVRGNALQVCYLGTLEKCEAIADEWNKKNAY